NLLTIDGAGATVIGGVLGNGSGGLTKTGTGTLTLNGSAANTFTGPVSQKGGTLVVDFANMATPTDLIPNTNLLAFGGGTVLIKGNSSGITSQTAGSATVNAGAAQALVNPNNGTSTTFNLGPITATAVGGSLLVGIAPGAGAGTGSVTTSTSADS